MEKGGESMQTPVRFYITQNDDQPVVRTIAMPQRASDGDVQNAEPQNVQVTDAQTPRHRGVAKIVRSAVKRTGSPK